MQIYNVQSNTNPAFKAKLKITDPDKILRGCGKYAEKAKTVHFFSSKELSEAKKLFEERTKNIKGTLSLRTFGDNYKTGWDYSRIELKRPSSAHIHDSIPVSVLNCAPPNARVRAGNYMYNTADKPTFNTAHELRKEYDEHKALLEYERKRPKLSNDSELVQKFDNLVKMQMTNSSNDLSLEIFKVGSQIVDEEMKLEEKLNPVPIGRNPKTVKTFVDGLVKMLKIMDKREKKMNDLLWLRDKTVALKALKEKKVINEQGKEIILNNKEIEKSIAKLEQKIDKLKFQLTVSDNITVGKIFGTDISIDDYIPKVDRNEFGIYYRKWGDYTYEDVKNFQSKNK